ncbi:hypothetical protein CAC42_388 [Sphaceloma murrayae]|uniref:Uncharacterized protein n=1 Tax=Sphaceloma murrayae TaxID=2082308 RepID=A0A2K1R3D3_9PEZI|nr:hypothetical protein CAC42_388 [Sphaceloma murrayae]
MVASLTAREMEVLGMAMISNRAAVDLDWDKFCSLTGYTRASANVAWYKLKKKLQTEQDAAPRAGKQTTTASKRRKRLHDKTLNNQPVNPPLAQSKRRKTHADARANNGDVAPGAGHDPPSSTDLSRLPHHALDPHRDIPAFALQDLEQYAMAPPAEEGGNSIPGTGIPFESPYHTDTAFNGGGDNGDRENGTLVGRGDGESGGYGRGGPGRSSGDGGGMGDVTGTEA